MAEVPVPKIIETRYFFIRLKIIFEILFLFLGSSLINCNIKAVSIAEVLASITIIIEFYHCPTDVVV